MTKRLFTSEQDNQIAGLYLQNYSTHKLAKIYNCDKDAISNALKRQNVNRRDNRSLSDSEEQQILKIYQAGHSRRKIARIYGKSQRLIKDAINRQLGKQDKLNDARFNYCEAEEQQIAKIYMAGYSIARIARAYGCLHKTIRKALNRQNIQTRKRNPKPPYIRKQRKPSKYIITNPTAFDNLNDEQALYWLGFCYADSDIRDNNLRLGLSIKDRTQLERLSIFLGGKLENITNMAISCRVNFSDKYLANQLTNLGIVVRRGEFWRMAKEIPDGLESHFIRGYIDGDGCIFNDSRFIILGQEDILQWIKEQFTKYANGSTEINFRQRQGILEGTWGGRFQFLRIADYVYKDATIFMKRKKDRYDKIKRA